MDFTMSKLHKLLKKWIPVLRGLLGLVRMVICIYSDFYK
jgi:hypothetical protein